MDEPGNRSRCRFDFLLLEREAVSRRTEKYPWTPISSTGTGHANLPQYIGEMMLLEREVLDILLRAMLDDGRDVPMITLRDSEINPDTEMMPIPSAPSISLIFDQPSTCERNLRTVFRLVSHRTFFQHHRIQRRSPSAILPLPQIRRSFSNIH